MFRRVPRLGAFRRCPDCGSDAASRILTSDAGEDDVTVDVRCGECAAWRSLTVEWRRALGVEQRLRAMAERHRRDIEFDLDHVRRAGLESGDLLSPELPTTPL